MPLTQRSRCDLTSGPGAAYWPHSPGLSGSGSARLGLSQKGGLPTPGERLVSFGPRSPTRAQPTQAPMAERPCAPAYVQRKERPYVLQNPLQSRGILRGPGAACSPAGQSRSPSPQLPRNIDCVPRSNANAKSSRTTKGKALGPLLNQGLRVLGAMGSEFPRQDALRSVGRVPEAAAVTPRSPLVRYSGPGHRRARTNPNPPR